MDRFYFDVLRDSQIVRDLEGTELPGLDEARAMAQLTARELLANAINSGDQRPIEAVAISNESGEKLAEIATRDVLPDVLK